MTQRHPISLRQRLQATWTRWRSRRFRLTPRPLRPDLDRFRLGRASEQLAARFLRDQGYAVERTNVHFPVGELDIVARDGQTLCFIEVRSTTCPDFGGAAASIDLGKRRRIIRAARWYLSRHLSRWGGPGLARQADWPPEIRFDVVTVDWAADGTPVVELIRGAFEEDWPS